MAGTSRSNSFPVGGEKKSTIQSQYFLISIMLSGFQSYLSITCLLSLLSRITLIMMKQLSSKNEIRETMSI